MSIIEGAPYPTPAPPGQVPHRDRWKVLAPIEPFARSSLLYWHEHQHVPCHSRFNHPRTPRLAAGSEIRGLLGAGRQSMPGESIWRVNGPQSANKNTTFGVVA